MILIYRFEKDKELPSFKNYFQIQFGETAENQIPGVNCKSSQAWDGERRYYIQRMTDRLTIDFSKVTMKTKQQQQRLSDT